MRDLITMAAQYLADPAPANPPGPTINTTGIVEWGVKFVLPIIMLLGGLSIAMKAASGHGQTRQHFQMVTGLLIGAAVIAAGGGLFLFAGSLVHLMLG